MRNLRSILFFHPALWSLMALQTLVIALWIAVDPRISLGLTNVGQVLFAVAACLFVTAAISVRFPARHRPAIAERTRIMALGLFFLLVTFTGVRFLNYLSMSLALPLADDLLDSWDRALGIGWHAYAVWLSRYPDMLPYISLSYELTIPSVAIVFVALVFLGKLERAKEFAALLFLAALLTVCISGFFPAEGAMARYGDDHLLVSFGPNAGVYYLEALRIVRESKDIVLSFADLPGLAAFPSFHTIVGLLIAYACRDSLISFVPASVLAGAMLLATPVYGGHYFIDVVAGCVVTAALAAAYATVKTPNQTMPRIATTDATRENGGVTAEA
jgi:hypothetical protein